MIDRCKIICLRGSDSDQIDLPVNVKQINLQMPNALMVSWVVGSLGGVVGGQLDGGGDVDSWSIRGRCCGGRVVMLCSTVKR